MGTAGRDVDADASVSGFDAGQEFVPCEIAIARRSNAAGSHPTRSVTMPTSELCRAGWIEADFPRRLGVGARHSPDASERVRKLDGA